MFLIPTLVAALAQGTPVPSAPPIQQAAAPPPAAIGSSYVPERVYDTRLKAFTDFETMLAETAKADIVFLGEQHDDPNTHRLELAVLEGLKRRKIAPLLSLEMFERDVQASLDRYLAGTADEAAFLKESRPWPRYATDYRGLVELARAQNWRVLAANIPRRLASEVAKAGREALDKLPTAERDLAARDLQCPQDGYYERFAKAMGAHPADAKNSAADTSTAKAATEADAKTLRYYWSQCAKDETMAESIARAFEARTGQGTLVHVNGAFHSDFGQGTVERVRRRLPGRRVLVVSLLPVADLDALAPAGDDLARADFLVYTVK